MTTAIPIHNQQGFTLVELMVAIVIMLIGVLATLSMISTSMNANTISNRLTTKTALAQRLMEDLLSRQLDCTNTYDLAKCQSLRDPLLLSTLAPVTETVTVEKDANYSVEFTTTANTPDIGITQIVVTVTRTQVPADSNSLVITSFRRVN